MNSTICWFCEKEFEYDGEQYRDVNCSHCGVQNSIYNPNDVFDPPTKEELEMINYSDEKYAGKYVYLPRVGEEATFEIEEVREAHDPRFNFKIDETIVLPDGSEAKKSKDLGFYVQAILADGKILSISNYAAFNKVFKKNEVNDGDIIFVRHIDKGEWEVTKKVNGKS